MNNSILVDFCIDHSEGFADLCRTFEAFLCAHVDRDGKNVLSDVLANVERKLVSVIEVLPDRDRYIKVVLCVVAHCVAGIGNVDDADIVSEYINMLKRLAKKTGKTGSI